MKKSFQLILGLLLIHVFAIGQETIYPAVQQTQATAITNATIHVGNGQVIEKGTIVFEKGKITYVGVAGSAPQAAVTVDAAGKHVYPGLILSNSNLGLREAGSGGVTQAV